MGYSCNVAFIRGHLNVYWVIAGAHEGRSVQLRVQTLGKRLKLDMVM